MPRVSVILPIYYTQPKFLHACIRSILAQTYGDFELLILNDSPDDTALDDIVAGYKDSRIRYFKSEQTRGVGGAYSELLRHASGKYVAIMNHDDIALPKRFAKQVEFLDKHPEVGLLGTGCKKFGSFWHFYRFSAVHMPQDDQEILALLGFKCPIIHPTIMFRKAIADAHNIHYHDQYMSLNDRLFYLEMSQHCKLANLDKILYKYRFHERMTSRVQKIRIDAEQYEFKKYWLTSHGIKLTEAEMAVYFSYVTRGRARIRDKQTLKAVQAVLEKMDAVNQQTGFLDKEVFRNVCGSYLTKRCMNAAVWGRISSKDIVATTTLPIRKTLLFRLMQALLGWKK